MKTLYEIYDDIKNQKNVSVEDLKYAVLMYRDLLWFANQDVAFMYKLNSDNPFTKLRYDDNGDRYKKALDQIPRKWLGESGIPRSKTI